jgi:hypothetical protein
LPLTVTGVRDAALTATAEAATANTAFIIR